jgi:hypothetical protein
MSPASDGGEVSHCVSHCDFLSNSSAQRQLLLAREQNGAILVAPAEPLRETRAAGDRTVRANIGSPSGNN